jgi:hypothetical protein
VTRRRAWVLRLCCEKCGHNVADVSATGSPPVNIQVRHRVPFEEYPAGAPAPTYTWRCHCGHPPYRRRHERLVGAYLSTPAGSVHYLILDRDV